MTSENEKVIDDSELRGDSKIKQHESLKISPTMITQRLIDLFTNFELKPWQMVEIYKKILEDYRSDSSFEYEDCVRKATASIRAKLAADADGGTPTMSDARDYAIELFSYFYMKKAEYYVSMAVGDRYTLNMSWFCANEFTAFYGWGILEDKPLPTEVDRIVNDSRDRLGIPRHFWKNGDPTEYLDVLTIILGKRFYESGCTLTPATDSEGNPEFSHYGIHSDSVRDYFNAFMDARVSPIEVVDIVRSAIKETLDLEHLSKCGLDSDPDKIAWRRKRINNYVENGLISNQGVDDIRREILRTWNPSDVQPLVKNYWIGCMSPDDNDNDPEEESLFQEEESIF